VGLTLSLLRGFVMVRGRQKKRSQTPPSCRRATSGAPIGHWRLRCAVAWPTGAQGQGPKGPRAKSLAHRLREAEPKVVAAVARIEADVAKSCPHVPGAVEPGAAAINPVRACRLFPS
jgi:hypothetical protein